MLFIVHEFRVCTLTKEGHAKIEYEIQSQASKRQLAPSACKAKPGSKYVIFGCPILTIKIMFTNIAPSLRQIAG
jgi:hypothetical protein